MSRSPSDVVENGDGGKLKPTLGEKEAMEFWKGKEGKWRTRERPLSTA